jgi:PhnB protein
VASHEAEESAMTRQDQKVRAIPEGFHTLTPVVVVKGCEEALAFYQRAFGGEPRNIAKDPTGKLVMHAEVKMGDSILFAHDEMPGMTAPAGQQLWVYTDAVDALWQRAVAAGCTVEMPLADMFWGDRFGRLKDPWGVAWSIAQHVKDITQEEQAQALHQTMKDWKK